MTRLAAACALAFALLAACDAADDAAPTADELEGIWVNVDAGTVRAFEFLALSRTYDLYVYADGASPSVNQSGTYEVSGGRLVTNVSSSLDPSLPGQSFANDFTSFTGGTFTLETSTGGRRTFTRSDALP